jgi:hypothetical protein
MHLMKLTCLTLKSLSKYLYQELFSSYLVFLTISTSLVISVNEGSSLDFVLNFFKIFKKSASTFGLVILIKSNSASSFMIFKALGFNMSILIDSISIIDWQYSNIRRIGYNWITFYNYTSHREKLYTEYLPHLQNSSTFIN